MSISFISVKCPDCGATLSIENGRQNAFCTYCGAKVMLHNENELVYRHIDEARIKEVEANRVIRLKELELEEARLRKQTEEERLRRQAEETQLWEGHSNDHTRKVITYIWLAVSLILVFIAVLLMLSKDFFDGFLFLFYAGAPIIGGGAYLVFKVIPEKESDKELLKSGGVRFPKGLEPFSENQCELVQRRLIAAGFTNVTCISKHDVVLGLFQKPGLIETITVDGKEITSGGHVYMSTAQIIITYHGR